MRFFNIVLSHSIFIAFCAVGISYETTFLLRMPVDKNILYFIFLSTLTSYNFYWLVCKYYFSQKNNSFLKNIVGHLALILIGCLGIFYFYNKANINLFVLLFSVILTCLYFLPILPFEFFKKLQTIGFLKTFLLALSWAFVTCLLPLGNRDIFTLPILLLFVARFLFIYMLCIMFDLRDVEKDKENGFESIATKINAKKVGYYYLTILFLFFITKVFFLFQTNNLINILATFSLCLVLLKTFYYSRLQKNFYFYYFYIDGLMLVSMLTNIFF